MLHHVSERHRPKLCSEASDDWFEGAVSRISNRMMQQMNKFPVKNSSVLGMLFNFNFSSIPRFSSPIKGLVDYNLHIDLRKLEKEVKKT